MTIDSTLLNPETLDLDDLLEGAWASLVSQGREPRDRESWNLGVSDGNDRVLMPLVERNLGQSNR